MPTGGAHVNDIAGWFDDVSKWLEAKGDYVNAENYFGIIAKGFYRKSLFDFSDNCYLEALYRTYGIVNYYPRNTKNPRH